MLIRHAEIWQHGIADLRVESGLIAAIGNLEPRAGETIVDARGAALLPGLHDHHIHMAGLAAQRASVKCSPQEVSDADGLRRALDISGSGWIRGIGFHESVLGGVLPDAMMLDELVPHRPLRLQHGTGRMWFLNTAAINELLERTPAPPGLQYSGGRPTGRLFDEDQWLQRALSSSPPDLASASHDLAAFGVTGITDMSPRNDPVMAAHFTQQLASGSLVQSPVLAGTLALADAGQDGWRLGPIKLHLHESALPDFDDARAFITAGHEQGRALAVHCVTEVELVFALALIEESGTMPGDRIEHVSVASPDLVGRMARLGLHACVQPHFIAERGDRYLAEVEERHHGDLYRLGTLRDAGIGVVGGSDAPYATCDPWQAMSAAINRMSPSGKVIGSGEALSPEQALALYLADPLDLSIQRILTIGGKADLCLLDRPWSQARLRLDSSDVRAAWRSGVLIHDRIHKPPFESLPGANPAA